MKLDSTLIARLSKPMQATWSQIGNDVMSCAQECGESISNESAIESCIDANRLKDCGNDTEADNIVSEVIAEHGYKKVMKFFCKNFQFA